MEDVVVTKGSLMIIRVPAELDHYISDQIRERSDEILADQSIREIDFDFRHTEFMDSSGIGLLMGRFRAMQLLGGKVKAIHAGERIRKILTISGVTRVIEVEPEKNWG